jgi:hypothetical protein
LRRCFMGINVATPMAGRKVCFQRRTKGRSPLSDDSRENQHRFVHRQGWAVTTPGEATAHQPTWQETRMRSMF